MIESNKIKPTAGWGEGQRLFDDMAKNAISLISGGDRTKFFQGLRVRDLVEGMTRMAQAVLGDEDMVATKFIETLAKVDSTWAREGVKHLPREEIIEKDPNQTEMELK